jgi:hypothetical protein
VAAAATAVSAAVVNPTATSFAAMALQQHLVSHFDVLRLLASAPALPKTPLPF